MSPRFGVAAVIIGNEVLAAQVVEANGAHLIQRLRSRGLPLRKMTFVPDEIDAIVEAVAQARRVADWVVTSGGIGPTHDDVTVRAVALALGRKVVRLPELAQEVCRHYGDDAPAEALRLADAPEGAELFTREGIWYPVLACAGVYMLPGVPSLFRAQLELVLSRLPSRQVVTRILYVRLGEPELAAVLDKVAAQLPEVAIGSYPQLDRGLDYRVKVTVEAAEAAPVEEACLRLRQGWPDDAVAREELHTQLAG